MSPRRAAAVGSVLATTACAGGAPAGSDSARSAAYAPDAMVGCVVDRAPLTIGRDTFVYVEPEDLIRVDSGFVVVGTPTYTWAPGTPGDSLPLTSNEHLAAHFTLDGQATLIERPIQDSIGSVRAFELRGDRWGVLFDIEKVTPPRTTTWTHSVWYAEHDGRDWSLLEPVPLPEGLRFDFVSSSEVVRVGEELVWVSVARLADGGSRVLEYRRTDGVWAYEVVSDAWVEISSLAYDSDVGLLLAHYAPDATLGSFRKSVRLYRRAEASWTLVQHVAVLPGSALANDLVVRIEPDGVAVSWRVDDEVGEGGYAVVGLDGASAGTRVDLDRRALQLVPLGPLGGHSWLVERVASDERSRELQLLGLRSAGGADVLAAVPSPYLGFFASLPLSDGEALIVGPEVSTNSADPFVRSLILRLSTSCT